MNRLRQGGSARISFFSFQDIITSVTGILILVTLLLSFSLRLDEEPEERRAERELRERAEKLAQIERENTVLQQQRIEATKLPNPEQVRVQVETLQKEALQTQAERERSQQEIERLKQRITASTPPPELRNEVSSLEKKVEELRAALAKEKTNANVLFIIPDPETQRAEKRPVAVVVSGDRLKAQRVGGVGAQELAVDSTASIRSVLRRYDPTREFVVFYFRPSGAKWFDSFRDEAKRAGFEVGYDAVEENKEVVFNAR
jgi:hypothetical protein